jgi:hypothetical protein
MALYHDRVFDGLNGGQRANPQTIVFIVAYLIKARDVLKINDVGGNDFALFHFDEKVCSPSKQQSFASVFVKQRARILY